MPSNCTLITALDFKTREETLTFLDKTDDTLQWAKVGLQLFTRYGPKIVEEIAARGLNIFLDLKLHDIPNTVASAVQSLSELPIRMLTLHASGGHEMLQAAREAQAKHLPETILLGVTVLTSMDDKALKEELGIPSSSKEQVLRLAKLCIGAGVQGLVCSPLEVPTIRESLDDALQLVIPGIRPQGSNTNEQKRIMTPKDAATAGASYIVVGRPITQAENPKAAAQAILEDIR